MSSPDQPRPDGDAVDIRTPADVSYVSTLRLAAASLGNRCGLTIDDIEDLRLAVDEACALLLPHALADSVLEVHFELFSGRLAVDVAAATDDIAGDSPQPDRDGFGWTVLGALASSVDVHSADGRLTISVTKSREAVQT